METYRIGTMLGELRTQLLKSIIGRAIYSILELGFSSEPCRLYTGNIYNVGSRAQLYVSEESYNAL